VLFLQFTQKSLIPLRLFRSFSPLRFLYSKRSGIETDISPVSELQVSTAAMKCSAPSLFLCCYSLEYVYV